MSQVERRRNPYPWTWEIPAGVAMLLLVLLCLAAQLGRTAANVFAGGGWRFAAGRELFASLPGLLAGNSLAGLPGYAGPAAAAGVLWVALGAAELALVAVFAMSVRVVWPRWGPGRLQGVASVGEANRLLGVARLRRHAAVIRPDLHRPRDAR